MRNLEILPQEMQLRTKVFFLASNIRSQDKMSAHTECPLVLCHNSRIRFLASYRVKNVP